MNVWDIVIIAGVAAAVIAAVTVIIKNRKKGKCSCGCDGCNLKCDKK